MNVKVLIYPGEDGFFVAECPSLPGCASQGQTRADALANIREAIEGWLEVQAERAADAERPANVEIVDLAV